MVNSSSTSPRPTSTYKWGTGVVLMLASESHHPRFNEDYSVYCE